MKPPIDYIFPPVENGKVPYWRLVLRGFSQLCFQSNELTGLIFFVAVLIASPIAAAYFLVAGLLAPVGRMAIGTPKAALETGLPGLNPGLIALSLPAFFETSWSDAGMWAVLVICVVATIVLVHLCVAVLPVPTIALPCLLVFWALYALAPHLDVLRPVPFSALAPDTFHPLKAVLLSLGQVLFTPTIGAGALFAAGMFLSNWRHGLIAVLGAAVGTAVAYYYRNVDPASVDTGLYGFNGVLTAVALFVICGGKLRLAILGALIATLLMPAIAKIGLPTLSAPFVLTTWLVLALGWVEVRWFDVSATAPSSSSRNAGQASPPAGET